MNSTNVEHYDCVEKLGEGYFMRVSDKFIVLLERYSRLLIRDQTSMCQSRRHD